MSRILDSMKTRIEKIKAKILPLQNELDSLTQAVIIMEKQELTLPSTTGHSKKDVPDFLKGHEKKAG